MTEVVKVALSDLRKWDEEWRVENEPYLGSGCETPFSKYLVNHGEEASLEENVVGWIYEDELPSGYPYDTMFQHSKVDGVRLFPIFAPPKPSL